MEMMKMRQQPDSSHMNKIIKQKALFLHNSRGGQINYKHEEAGLINMMGGNNHGVDYERDESPVSVISHSASVISQPSSACTSMEHHLLLSPPSINSNPDPIHNSHYAYRAEHFSVLGTSAACTSEDDSSAYNLPTLFFEVAPLQEENCSAQQLSVKEDSLRNSSGEEELDTQQSFANPIKRKSLIKSGTSNSVGPFSKSNDDDDDELMISIDLQGWQEINSSLLKERFIKGSEKKLNIEEEKRTGDKPITTLEQNDERKDQKLERSTSHCQAAPVVQPTKFHNAGEKATSHMGRYEAESLKGSQPAQRNVNLLTQKAPPGLTSRQKSINSTKSSKWDDAEKWLCYDNHVSHHHNIKHSSFSAQKWDSDNDAISDRAAHSVSKVSNQHKNNHASLARRHLGGSKVYEHYGPKEDVACGSGADTNVTPSRESLSSDVMSRSKHACAPQSANPYGFLKNNMLEDDNVKRKWLEANLGTCRKADFGYMSSDELVYPHLLISNKLPAVTANDGQLYANNTSDYETNHVSQMSLSSGSISGEDSKRKNHSFKAGFVSWKKDKLDEPVAYSHRMRECDYLSSGELLSQANNNNHRNLVAISTSDGEMYAHYASYQQHKNNVSYAQRLKHHQLLQKLRKKCSPSDGGHKEVVHHVKKDAAQNFVGTNAYGGVASVHAASRLSIPMQASSSKDQLWTEGEYGRTQCVGKQESEDESTCITTTRMQREFVVQTPMHGRSASMKDACTEVSPTVSRRDIGTQMTPSESSPFASKCTSPLQNTSPARHNTPARMSPVPLNPQINHINIDAEDDIDISKDVEDKVHSSSRRASCGNAKELESCHWAKLELRDLPSAASEKNDGFDLVYSEWSPGVGVEGEIGIDEGDHETDGIDEEVNSGGLVQRLSALDARAAAWEGAERAKFHAKFKREEARINAWETLQKAKAQAELKKLEVKLERLRSKATEKVLTKVAAAERRAEEMRAAAEAQQAEQMRKVRERACNLRKTALFPGSFAVCFARNYMP